MKRDTWEFQDHLWYLKNRLPRHPNSQEMSRESPTNNKRTVYPQNVYHWEERKVCGAIGMEKYVVLTLIHIF